MNIITAALVRLALSTMKKRPALEIYPGDWLQDDIAGCSIAANGFWWRAMLVMHAARPYGHMVGANGLPLDEATIVKRCGLKGRQELQKIVAEIEAAGVPGRTGDDAYQGLFRIEDAELDALGTHWHIDLSPLSVSEPDVIYSRRMVRDRRTSLKRFFASPIGQTLITQNRNLTTQNADVCTPSHARADAEDGDKKKEVVHVKRVGVQGEGVPPDFSAVKSVIEKISASALRTKPSEQIVITWCGTYGPELILETLIDCEPEYRGKGYQYLERILTTRRDDPSQRPGNRRARSKGNGKDAAAPTHPEPPPPVATPAAVPNEWTKLVKAVAPEPDAPWISEAHMIDANEREILIGVPSQQHVDEIREGYGYDIRKVKRDRRLTFVVVTWATVQPDHPKKRQEGRR